MKQKKLPLKLIKNGGASAIITIDGWIRSWVVNGSEKEYIPIDTSGLHIAQTMTVPEAWTFLYLINRVAATKRPLTHIHTVNIGELTQCRRARIEPVKNDKKIVRTFVTPYP